jgi:hypothetical protein
MRQIDQFIMSLSVNPLKGIIDAFNGQIRIKDQDSICSGVEQRIQPLFLI